MRRPVLFVLAAPACGAWTPVPHNPADALRHVPLDAFRYDEATHCVKHPATGALKLQAWLATHVRGVSRGILRCEMWGRHSASLQGEHLQPYSTCYTRSGRRRAHVDATAGHLNHVHIGLNRLGARAQTSFWTHRGR